jgi:hypothetical protein
MKEHIIVGVDPGTTTAFSAIDLDGNAIATQSKRQYDLGTLINDVIQHGNPLLVGCDKGRAPEFVRKFAIKVGAKLVAPDDDLLVDEKKALVAIDTDNDHEMDAHASAKFALQRNRRLLRKITERVEDDTMLYDVIKDVVKDGKSIADAMEDDDEPESQTEQRDERSVKVVRPTSELRKQEKTIAKLKQRVTELEDKLAKVTDENQRMKKRIDGMPVADVVKQKERTIKHLGNQLDEARDEIEARDETIDRLKHALEHKDDFHVAKRYPNLSSKHVDHDDITEGSVFLVDDPNVASEDVVEALRDNLATVIHESRLTNKHNGVTYVDADDVSYEEVDEYVLFEPATLKHAHDQANVLKKVVTEYRQERSDQP